VKKVTMPPLTSRPTVDPRSVILKNVSTLWGFPSVFAAAGLW
jgi:hypothetical protein